MRQFITNSCTSILTCGETILYILRVAFFSAPAVAISNMALPRYIIIGAVFLILWIISYIVSNKYTEKGFVRRGWMFGVRWFWIFTFMFFRTWFPIPARAWAECWFCWPDYPPYSSLISTIANILIWQGIGYTIAYFFKLQKKNRTLTILSLITIWLILFGFGVLALLFD